MASTASKDPYKKTMAEMVVYSVRIFALVAITLLTLRFFLLLFGANPSSSFTEWIYNSSAIVLQPFRGIFNSRVVSEETGSILDVSVLFAIIMYMLLAYWMGTLIEAWEDRRLTNHKRQAARQRARNNESE